MKNMQTSDNVSNTNTKILFRHFQSSYSLVAYIRSLYYLSHNTGREVAARSRRSA